MISQCNTVERFKLACLAKLTWCASYFQVLNECTLNVTFSAAAMTRRVFKGTLIYFRVK